MQLKFHFREEEQFPIYMRVQIRDMCGAADIRVA